jgi:steroid 5-alpha reductase family enzyme
MTNKQRALIEVSIYYIIIGAAGLGVFLWLEDYSSIERFIYADLGMTLLTFIFSLIKKNSSMYDAYWSVIPFYFLLVWFIYYEGNNWNIYQWACTLVISFWSWRLTFNWGIGWPGWQHEDWRYVNFRHQFKSFFQPINFLAIHLYPTVIVFLSMLGLFWVFEKGELEMSWLFWIGIATSLLGTLLELFADRDLMRFRQRPNPQKTDLLDTGLWAYSRNPNYLGEILFWFGLLFCALGFGAPWYTAIGSVGMLLMFVFASIPMKEKQMMKKRPEQFMDYKSRVPRLLPRVGK